MNHRFHFRPQDYVELAGIAYQPSHADGGGYILRSDESPDFTKFMHHSELRDLLRQPENRVRSRRYSTGRRQDRERVHINYLSQMEDVKKQKVFWKHRYVTVATEFIASGQAQMSESSLSRVLEQITARVDQLTAASESRTKRSGRARVIYDAPCARSVLNWVAAYARNGHDILALARKRAENAPRRIDPRAEGLITQVINEHYLTRQKKSARQVYERLIELVSKENKTLGWDGLPPMQCPSYRTLLRRIKALDPFEVTLQREGPDAAARNFYFYQSGTEPLFPGERVEIDEWHVDLLTVYEVSGVTVTDHKERAKLQAVRLFLYAAIDCATRCILGFKLCFAANTNDAIQILKQIGEDKSDLAAAIGCETSWPYYCGVGGIWTDQGPAFASARFAEAVTDLGWFFTKPPAGVPQLRGTIERFFRTLGLRLTPHLTGRTFGSIAEKGDYPAEDLAALSEDDLIHVLMRFIVDDYHNAPQAELGGISPKEAWEDLAKKYGTLPPPDPVTKVAALGLPSKARLNRHGLRACGMNYQSERLQEALLHSHKREFDIRINQDDLAWIAFFHDGEWHAARAVLDVLDGISYGEWREYSANLIATMKNRAELSEPVMQRARTDILKTSEAARARRRLGTESFSPDEVAYHESKLFLGLAEPIAEPEFAQSDAEIFSNEIGVIEAEDSDTPTTEPAPAAPKWTIHND